MIEQMGLWAEQAETEIRSWPGTAGLGMTRQTRATLEDLVTRLEQHADRAAAAEGPWTAIDSGRSGGPAARRPGPAVTGAGA